MQILIYNKQLWAQDLHISEFIFVYGSLTSKAKSELLKFRYCQALHTLYQVHVSHHDPQNTAVADKHQAGEARN